jgi:hypothetical protein
LNHGTAATPKFVPPPPPPPTPALVVSPLQRKLWFGFDGYDFSFAAVLLFIILTEWAVLKYAFIRIPQLCEPHPDKSATARAIQRFFCSS